MGDDMCHPQPGDLIEIDRPLCQHWVLYMGDGDVVHLSPINEGAPSVSGSSASIQATRAMVKKECLQDVVKNNRRRVNNKYDRSHTPLPVEKIIQRAKRCIDKEVPYDVVHYNCEHFVTMLRYGEPLSEQVTNAVVGGSVVAGAVLGLAAFCTLSANSSSEGAPRKERKH